MHWYSKTRELWVKCDALSQGTSGKNRIRPEKFLTITIPLPPLEEQRRIVAKLDRLAAKIEEVRRLRSKVLDELQALLRAVFAHVTTNAKYWKMQDVAPLVRRRVEPNASDNYPELGIRSFGKGTFHKPSLDALDVGSKKLYRIEPGDLVFNNVFAWEGAVAVAQPEDAGRFGSHRFITCLPKRGVVTAEFLCFYFLTPEGLEKLGKASPGGAGRNRTLGLEKLAEIEVPVPPYEDQVHFDSLQREVKALIAAHHENMAKLDALLRSILDRAFKGAL
jgi:type I restriction enzyme S subunit